MRAPSIGNTHETVLENNTGVKMNKKIVTFFILVALVSLVYIFASKRSGAVEPVVFTEHASLRALSIDDKINEAELIIIGEVRTVLPSKWKRQNEKDVRNATPQEIFESGLFTDSIITIKQIFKGNAEGVAIRVRSFIGETEQVRLLNSSQPVFERGKKYLLLLRKDFGPTSIVEPGHYKSVNANTAVYEIIGDMAKAADDEWLLEELIVYIQNKVAESTIMPTLEDTSEPTETPLPVETEEETPTP
jgi:hypothetical protein